MLDAEENGEVATDMVPGGGVVGVSAGGNAEEGPSAGEPIGRSTAWFFVPELNAQEKALAQTLGGMQEGGKSYSSLRTWLTHRHSKVKRKMTIRALRVAKRVMRRVTKRMVRMRRRRTVRVSRQLMG